ncbi:MAG: 7-cyano-7-deazaguanine synthase, partial [Methanobacteriota archaeon]
HVNAGDGIPQTYVPFRNANLLSVATSFAESRGADAIFIGVQSSDYSGYPDCRPEFIHAFQQVIDLGTRPETRIVLKTPFVNLNKAEILRIGMNLSVPYEDTWSCYQDGEAACGVCGSCHFRQEAFQTIGIDDPIPYR